MVDPRGVDTGPLPCIDGATARGYLPTRPGVRNVGRHHGPPWPRLPQSREWKSARPAFGVVRLAGVSGPGFNVVPVDPYHAPSHLVPEQLHVAVDHEGHQLIEARA